MLKINIEINLLINDNIKNNKKGSISDSINQSIVSADIIHTVSRGETLQSIGKQYDINWHELAKYNHILPSDFIKSGTEIRIPCHQIIVNKLNHK